MKWEELKREFIKDYRSKNFVLPERRLVALENIEMTFKIKFPELIEDPNKMLELGKIKLIEMYDDTKDYEKIKMAERWVLASFIRILSHPPIKMKFPKNNNAANRIFQASDLIEIIARGENKFTEFKSSLRYDVKGIGIPKEKMEHSVMKTIAAYLNSEGGTLLIGVDDQRNILGLEATDYTLISKTDKKDQWSLIFDTAIENYLGNHMHFLLDIQFISIEDKTIVVVKVKPSSTPIWIKNEKQNEVLYIRRTASTAELQGRDAVEYVKRWKH